MKLTSVSFEENTANREDIAKGGLVFVNHTKCSCKGVSFLSKWDNVTAIGNQGKVSHYDNSHQGSKQGYQNTTKITGNLKNPHPKYSTTYDPILNSLFVVYSCNANLTFHSIRSDYNIDLRFLGLRCCHSYVRIYKSGFHRHIISGPGGVVYVPDGEMIDVSISDSDFTRNVGSIGGVLHIDGGDKKTACLKLSNVSFLYCSGNVTGCAISVGKFKKRGTGVAKHFVFFKGVIFDRCHNNCKRGESRNRFGPLCVKATRITNVIIQDSIFRKNKNRKASAVYIH
jgi:hypothetical protein